jgi:hypothetical protein
VPSLVAVHCVAPGEHATHAPFQQMGVAPAHVVWFIHWPEALHCWTTVPTHCVWPGAHSPVQVFATHAWFTQHFVPHVAPPSQSGGAAASFPTSARASMGLPVSVAFAPDEEPPEEEEDRSVVPPVSASVPGMVASLATPSQEPPSQLTGWSESRPSMTLQAAKTAGRASATAAKPRIL